MSIENNNVFYLYLQSRLLEKSDRNGIVNIKEACYHIWNTKIPKSIYFVLLKELENMNLISRINRYEIKIINKKKCEKIKKINDLYHRNGIF